MVIDNNIVGRNFGRAAKTYEANARLQIRVAEELIQQAGRLHGRILDIGAGPGVISRLSGMEVTALDVSYDMCVQNRGEVVNADMHDLPFADEAFDNVVASLSLQWSQNVEKVFAEVNRVLKSGGRFAFSTFAPDSLKQLREAFAYIDQDQHLMEFEHAIKVFAMLKKAGFENLVMNSQKISYNYPDMMAALRSIKNIGANYGYANHKSLRGKKYFARLENVYKGITKAEQGVPLHWEVLYIRADKA